MIDKLTPEQEKMMHVYKQKYIDNLVQKNPIDPVRLKKDIDKAYKLAGLKAPKKLIIAPSPFKAMCIIKERELGRPLKDTDRVYNGNYMWGSQDGFWIGHARFAQYIGVKYPADMQKKLDVMDAICEQSGWWFPYEDFCVVSEKPVQIKWEDARLHNPAGPAVLYADGFALYSWRGTNVPKEWIEGGLTPSIALSQTNAEMRRVACEIIGWHKVLEDPSLNPKTINEDLPHIGTLISVDLPDAKDQWFIKFQCGTGRWFAEPVNDKRYDTALKANAGGNGWRIDSRDDPSSFIPFIRT